MTTTHDEVLASLKSWSLEQVVTVREVRGKTEVAYNGEKQVFPHWLALRKVNQIGGDYRPRPTPNPWSSVP